MKLEKNFNEMKIIISNTIINVVTGAISNKSPPHMTSTEQAASRHVVVTFQTVQINLVILMHDAFPLY